MFRNDVVKGTIENKHKKTFFCWFYALQSRSFITFSGRTLTTAWRSLNAAYVKDLWLRLSFYIIINASASFHQNKTEVILKLSFLWHVVLRQWLMEGKGFRCRVKHEAWTFTLPVNEACEWGPGNSYVGNWDRTSAAEQRGLWECGAQRCNTKGNSIKR